MSERRWAVFLALSVVVLVLLTLARCVAPAVEPVMVTPTAAPVLTILPASPTVYRFPTMTPTLVREVILDRPLLPTATSLPAVILLPTEPPTKTPTPEGTRVIHQRG